MSCCFLLLYIQNIYFWFDLEILEVTWKTIANSKWIFIYVHYNCNIFYISVNKASIYFFKKYENFKNVNIPPLDFNFSYILKLSTLCMNEEKWKKSWKIKLTLRSILEQLSHVEFFSFLFLEELKIPKRHFEINWPLLRKEFQPIVNKM